MELAKQNLSLPRICVLGAGGWGRKLSRIFHMLGALKLICDTNESLTEDLKTKYREVETCCDSNLILHRSDIDGIVIATPASSHYQSARAALLSGKHVFVQMPLALHEHEGLELIDIARNEKKILMVGNHLQYHPAFMKLKEMCLCGELGRINYIYCNRLDPGKSRKENNSFWSFAPHDIAMILSLAQDEPETVHAIEGHFLNKTVADVITSHFSFRSGLQAQLFVSWLHSFKEQKLVVVGDRKVAVFNASNPWENKLYLYKHQVTGQRNSPFSAKADPEKVQVGEKEPLRQECEHFLHCIQTGDPPITDGIEGIKLLRVIDASQKSLDLRGNAAHLSSPRPNIENERDFFIHATAICDEGAKIGKGSKIWHFSHIIEGSLIGRNCNIGQNVVVGPDVTIGNGCKIQNNVSVYKGVTLEDGVFCGPSMVFTNIYNPRAEIRKMDQVRPTLVKRGATLGANSTIVCGATIGRYAFIGAGTVVNRNVPDHALVVGNPGNQIGWACTCGERLSDNLTCLACDRCFKKTGDGLKETEKQ